MANVPENRVVCLETVATLEELVRQARRGDLIGVSAITLAPSGAYQVVFAGSALACPTFTIGALVRATFELERVASDARVE